jgi:hypothetical protein
LAQQRGVKLVLPVDVVVARSLHDDVGCCTVPVTPGCCSSDCPCVPDGRPNCFPKREADVLRNSIDSCQDD